MTRLKFQSSEAMADALATRVGVDHEAERADLVSRARDAGQTPGERAANEEADLREARAVRLDAAGAYGDAAAVRKSAEGWRSMASRAADEDRASGVAS